MLRLRFRTLLILRKPQANTIHTVPLIRGRGVPLSFEDMTQMPATVAADDLRPFHAKSIIHMSGHRSRNRIKVCWPAAARLELMVGFVERRVAPGAVVHALRRVVGIVLSRAGALSSLLAEDAELFWTPSGLVKLRWLRKYFS